MLSWIVLVFCNCVFECLIPYRQLERYRRLLFEPVTVDDDSQRLLDESYESNLAIYGRGINPGRLTPQDCMNHCKKVYYYSHAKKVI